MTLSGNLGFVPLDEVLRLLTRAGNEGVVEITNRDTSGRIFVNGEGIGLATTFDDIDLKDHLVSSGYLSPADAAGSSGVPFNEDLVALIREMTVESIYRMDGDEADFAVVRDLTSPYASSEPFDLERILDDSRKRADEWERVTKRIPDLEETLKINRSLSRETVELDRESWRLLSELGGGASVKELATALGTTTYAVANVAGAMVDNDLLVLGDGAAGVGPSYDAAAAHEVSTVPVYEDETVSPVEDEVDPDRSWWDEPENEPSVDADTDETADQPPAAAEVEAEADGAAEDVDADEADVDDAEDTEAFLEKVFSEVSSETPEEDGHGLMRRRRMGSILRELGEE
ncbi:MAG: DUF4388 domain-containing protein [Acidimicrobiia bacterium]